MLKAINYLILFLIISKNKFGACLSKTVLIDSDVITNSSELNQINASFRNMDENLINVSEDEGLSESELIALAEAVNQQNLSNDYNDNPYYSEITDASTYRTTPIVTTMPTTQSTSTTTTTTSYSKTKTTRLTTTTKYYKPAVSYNYYQASERVEFNRTLVIVWEKKDVNDIKQSIFGGSLTNNDNLIVWYYPGINSLVFEIVNENYTSTYSILRLPTFRFDSIYFTFEDYDKVNIYIDCPSTNSPKLSWSSDSIDKIVYLKLFSFTEVHKSLSQALKQNKCRLLITVYQSVLLYLDINLSTETHVILLSFNSDGYFYSLIYFNGHLKLVSSDGSNTHIGILTEHKKFENGIYFLFLNEAVQIYSDCPSNRLPVVLWKTNLFRHKIQIETSIKFSIGSALTQKFIQKYCFTKFLYESISNNYTKYIPARILNNYLDIIIKIGPLVHTFLPKIHELVKIEEFKSTPGFSLAFLVRPEQRVLIALRYNARRSFFDRSINDYVHGFSDGRSNFWIGLSNLNKVTYKNNYRVRIEIEYKSKVITEEYGLFKVGDESEKYKLTIGNLIRGVNAYFENHNYVEFSTYDFGPERGQALRYAGGFWHRPKYGNEIDNFYCFSCEDKVDYYGSSFNNTLSHISVATHITKIYLIV